MSDDFFSNLIGSAISTAVTTGTKALVSNALIDDKKVQVIGAGNAGLRPEQQKTTDQLLKSVLDDADIGSGFVGEVPSVGGILSRQAGRADPAVSTRTNQNELARMLIALKSPEVAKPVFDDLAGQIKAPRINMASSSRRKNKSLRKLLKG